MLRRVLTRAQRVSNLKSWHHRFASHRGLVIGLMRETYNPWERRAPLCPDHVSKLLEQEQQHPSDDNNINKVLVQPSELRIFPDKQYEHSGASITDDLSHADLILGVKRPENEMDLLPNKTYAFFSHVIKGQPENMALLRHVLDNGIQLLDYECILRDHQRIVAFGKFAGIAGTNDALHALGRRLLCHGYSTPFLHIPPAYTYEDWNDAKHRLRQVGGQISEEGIRTPYPIIFCLTGEGGKAHSGALAVMKELPVEFVAVEDLPDLVNKSGPHTSIYCVSVGMSDLFVDRDTKVFDLKQYQEHPEEFVSTFCDKIAPFATVLVNTQYWDERFPRLLTKKAIQRIHSSNHKDVHIDPRRLQIVADVSCDINGSVEFLHRTTTVERPFFEYDVLNDQEMADDVTGEGITVAGVDILPSELPKDSSEYFGDALLPLVQSAIETSNNNKSREAADILHPEDLPTELKNACITSKGKLLGRFKYIDTLMSKVPPTPDTDKVSMILTLNGHVFDSGLINQSLDVIEAHGCGFEILNCRVQRKQKSLVVVQVSASDIGTLDTIHAKLHSLAEIVVGADTQIRRSEDGAMLLSKKRRTTASVSQHKGSSGSSIGSSSEKKEQRVLVLGSGMVSKSTVEYLGRKGSGRKVVVAGIDEREAREIASHARNNSGEHVVLDAQNDPNLLADQIHKSDLVVSLLPARLHPKVAETCIEKATNLVTASYESEAMRQLSDRAKGAGVTILNEVGLDPGLDHMSAMRIIDTIQERGGDVSKFESYCGGLPSPSAANNPLRYKFSWSPRGVLEACLNDARFKSKGDVFFVPGEGLLTRVTPFLSTWGDLDLECLPNRDSLVYLNKYGIQSAETCFRGTLRYSGYSALMDVFKSMGLLMDTPAGEATTWKEWMELQRRKVGGSMYNLLLQAAHDNVESSNRALECCKYLGMFEDLPLSDPNSMINSFSALLAEKLRFDSHESDMVVMQHEIVGLMPDGTIELHTSSMQAFGGGEMSAMAKTVGYTTAVGAELLLNKQIAETGSLLPIQKSIYKPMLDRLAEENIRFEEDCIHLESEHNGTSAESFV